VAASLSAGCPVADGTSLQLGFKVRAETTASGLAWRRSADSFDAVFPGSGAVGSNGTTSVSLTDVALSDRVAFEVTEGGKVVLRFVIRHR
jgi:hypothetical protein